MRRFLKIATTTLALGAASLAAGCGDDDAGPSPVDNYTPELPTAVVSVQERLASHEVAAIAADDTEFAALLGSMNPETAGTLEDDAGNTVVWATGGSTTIVRGCAADGTCTYAEQTWNGNALSWSNGTPLTVGRPSLLKTLEGLNLSDKTVISPLSVADRSRELQHAELPAVDFQKRQFVALNTFGPVFGTTMDVLTAAANDSGAFDEVTQQHYVSAADVADALEDLDHTDALVWLTQGVQQEAKSDGRSHRTVALTVNDSVYGDATMSRDLVANALELNVTSGPGVIVLAASNSYGDGSDGQPDEGSLWQRVTPHGCVVVGVQGKADVGAILAASAHFIASYTSGNMTLGEALAQANRSLDSASLVANADDTTRFANAARAQQTAPTGYEGTPRISVPFTAVAHCAPAGQPKVPTQGTFVTAWADVTFDGPYFSGQRILDTGGLRVNTTVRGLVTGWTTGDLVLVEAYGNLGNNADNFYGLGQGVIGDIAPHDDGSITFEFMGLAHTAEFINEDGEECIFNNPRLATTVNNPATITLMP